MAIVKKHEINPLVVMRLAEAGHTQKEIAYVLGIPTSTFEQRVKRSEKLQTALMQGAENPNRNVMRALYQRALGYDVVETVELDGKPVKRTLKHMAGSVSAQELWLRCRDPENWNVPRAVNMTLTLRDKVAAIAG